MRQISTVTQKRQTRFIRACRLIFINITLSNRIVKPNSRYARQPASHDFLFYSAPDKVYVLTASNRIAMRFAVRSAPPFRYRTKHTDYSTGGIYSGFQPQAELGAAHSRKKRSQHITVTAYLLIIALFDPAVLPRLANLKHFQRRNLQWLSATGGI